MTYAYTHADHARSIVIGHIRGERITIKPTHVQARIGHTVCCARIVTAWDTVDGLEMWQLDLLGPLHGRMSAPARNVRLFQGVDGRCTCAPADFSAATGAAGAGACDGAGRAGALALPVGNHGENVSTESDA